MVEFMKLKRLSMIVYFYVLCSAEYKKQAANGEETPRFRPFDKTDPYNVKFSDKMPGYYPDGKYPKNDKSEQTNESGKNYKSKNGKQSSGKGNDIQDILNYLFNDVNVNFVEINPNDLPEQLSSQSNNKRKRKNSEDEFAEYKKRVIDYPYKWLGNSVNNISDLIKIGNDFDPEKEIRANLNLLKLNKLVNPLQNLSNMVGLQEVKNVIFEEAIYFLQDLDEGNKEMLHTVITEVHQVLVKLN